jgi:hypothetical protein
MMGSSACIASGWGFSFAFFIFMANFERLGSGSEGKGTNLLSGDERVAALLERGFLGDAKLKSE